MNRTEITYRTKKSVNEVEKIIQNILSMSGYEYVNYNNSEKAWKKGKGILEASQYIKVLYGEHEVTIFGWIKALGLEEQDLNGVMGSLPKKKVLKVINKIKNSI